MFLLDLKRAIEFSAAEYEIFEFICNAYLEYDGKYASFLYQLMKDPPEKTDYKFKCSGITVKWFKDKGHGTLGAFNPMWPHTFFLVAPSQYNDRFPKTKKELKQEAEWAAEQEVSSTPTYVSPTMLNDPSYWKRQEISVIANWILTQFPIIMHELYHMLQFKASVVGYVAMRFVSIFTTIPYYLFQNAEWMPKFRKFFEWDIEGQAEKYGNNAPNIEAFCHELDSGLSYYSFEANTLRCIERRHNTPNRTQAQLEEDEESERCSMESLEYMRSDLTPFARKNGKKLFELVTKWSKA